MMRLMCGSGLYAELEILQRKMLVSQIADGLYWNRFQTDRPWATLYNPTFDGQRKPEDVANVGGNGRMLLGLGDLPCARPAAALGNADSRPGRRAAPLPLHRNDYSYYPDGGFGEPFNYPRSGWVRTDEPKSQIEGGEAP